MTIGATITLNNQYCDTYEVIGVNHDGTIGTVDIMAHTQAGYEVFSTTNTNVYKDSSARVWINGTYFNAFSDNIRNAAKTMSVVTNTANGNVTTEDKVKLLSGAEIGLTSNSFIATNEGSLYTGVFTPGPLETAIMNRWRDKGTYGSTTDIWLRTRSTYGSGNVANITYAGSCGYSADNRYAAGLVPVLRF